MKIFLLSIITLFPITGFAQYVYFASPTNPWKDTPAQIEETSIDVYPKGNFAEVELFISFSSTNPGEFADEEFIEMISYFSIPEDVAVSDLWLWFEDEILKAHIIDRWSANRIYEDIVNRQKDPAIIYKNSETEYELRIYPFLPDQTRKIKLSFLIPMDVTESSASIQIPNFYHRAINTVNSNPTIRYWTEENSPTISFREIEDVDFNAGVDSTGRKYWETEIEAESFNQSSITLTKKESIPNVSLSTYIDSTNNDQYYSFSLIPKNILEIDVSKKVAVVFDVALSNTTHSMEELKLLLKNYLKDSFDSSDNFNLFYSNLSAQQASEGWLSGTDATIDSVLASIGDDDISGFSNLDDLLASAFDFISDTDSDGEILLISSSDTYLNFQDANAFAESIFDYTDGNLPQMTIVDIQDEDVEWRWGNGIYYQGNEYLYNILTIESGGELFNYNDTGDINGRMELGFERLEGVISDYDIYSTFNSGFSYSRFSNRSISKLPLNSTFIQTGKYYGELPLTIQFSGTFGDTVFNQQLEINESSLADGTLKRFWVANKIHEMESSFPTNEDISVIIDYSIDNRIMSQYTSFLALEPGDSALVDPENLTGNDGGVIINTTEEEDTPESFKIDTLKAYPNPFNPSVNIEVQLSEAWDASASSITIYNVLGQQVAVLQTSQFQGQISFTVNWDISRFKGELSTGLYLVRVVTPYTSKYIKITYLK